MKRPVLLIYILSLIFISWPCHAQVRTVRGVVTDSDGNPLPGAGVLVKEMKGVGVSTDLDGRFEISVPQKGKTLVFSSLGMETVEYEIPQRGADKVEISLDYEQNSLEQVVVTGYAQTTVKRITGSVGIISSEKLEASPLASVSSLMQGQIAGVSISAV